MFKRVFVGLVFAFCSGLFFCSSAHAFNENFTGSFEEPWVVSTNSGQIQHLPNSVVLSGANFGYPQTFPYIRTAESFDLDIDTNFQIEFAFRYTMPGRWGTGLSVSQNIPENGNGMPLSALPDIMIFQVWQGVGGFRINTTLCPSENPQCERKLISIPFSGSGGMDTSWHAVRIVYLSDDNHYEVYLDDNYVPIFISAPSDILPVGLWAGNPSIQGSGWEWSSIEIDYIRVEPIEIEEERDKIILLPGMFASWNYPAILNGQPGKSWMIPEWIKTYNNVIASLENEGYILNEDLFVFPYDWRKKLFDLSDDLNDYMNNLKTQSKLEEDEQIDLVGHSFGGLVARAYESEYGDSLIDQIIAIGTPNLGVTQAYGAWEGLQTWNASWWQSQMIQLLVRFNQDLGELPIETLRRMSPSIQDVLPTYNFLNKNGANVSINEMNQQNTNLPDINEGDYEVEVIAGKGEETIDQLNIKQRSKIEELLGLWEDGKPIEKLMSDGDGTVLLSSAKADFDNNSEIEANHGEIVFGQEGITTLFGRLGLSETSVVVNETADEHDSALVVVLRSPGVIKLLDSSGNEIDSIIDDNGKILWLPGVADGRYKMKVMADGETGDYELHLGYVQQEEADWEVFFGKLRETDEEDEVVFDIHRDQVKLVSRNGRSGGSNAVKYSIDELIERLSKTEKAKEQLRILRQIKFWSHRLYAQYTREGNQEDADMVMGLLDEYDLWSEEIINESGYEIKKQQVNGRRRLVINLEKTISRWKWYTKDLSKAREKLQIAEDYYKNKKYALADEYYYSAWLHLSRVF